MVVTSQCGGNNPSATSLAESRRAVRAPSWKQRQRSLQHEPAPASYQHEPADQHEPAPHPAGYQQSPAAHPVGPSPMYQHSQLPAEGSQATARMGLETKTVQEAERIESP